MSIDDTKAGQRLAQFALDSKQCKEPYLLLERTGWGKSNFKTITSSLEQHSLKEIGVSWFQWNTKINSAKQILNEIMQNNADCILYVGNAIEGEEFARAMVSFPEDKRLPIISH